MFSTWRLKLSLSFNAIPGSSGAKVTLLLYHQNLVVDFCKVRFSLGPHPRFFWIYHHFIQFKLTDGIFTCNPKLRSQELTESTQIRYYHQPN